jgi:hypothetical protein
LPIFNAPSKPKAANATEMATVIPFLGLKALVEGETLQEGQRLTQDDFFTH